MNIYCLSTINRVILLFISQECHEIKRNRAKPLALRGIVHSYTRLVDFMLKSDKTRVIGVTSTNSALLSDIFRYFRLYVREKRLLFVEPLDIKEVPSLS